MYGLRISTNDIRLIGKPRAGDGDAGKVRVLHTGTQETGIYAAPAGCEYRDGSCPETLQNFYIRGFTVEGFPVNGIQTRFVDGFRFIRNESANNLNNGIYPTLSANGYVANNESYGSLDTAMWVAGSENVRVIGNKVHSSTIGYEITVSNNVFSARNEVYNNTLGIGLFHPNAAGNPPLPVMENWVFVNNDVYDNNLPNPAPPGTFQSALFPGVGVLLLGVSNHEMRNNTITGHETFGLALAGWCSAIAFADPNRNCLAQPPITDPSANDNYIARNFLDDNGSNPVAPFPGVDLLYLQTPPDETGTGNCFERNDQAGVPPSFDSNFPGGGLPDDGC